MSTNELIAKIEELRSLEELVKEAEQEIEGIKDSIKQQMNDQQLEELEAGTHIIRYTTVISDRFDSTRFKKEHGDMYREYSRKSTSRRFTISD